MAPTRLHHADLRIGKVRHQPHQKVGRGYEVGIEDGDKLSARDRQPLFERARLVSDAVGAVDVLNVVTLRREPSNSELRDLARLVRRIVQHLNLEQTGRVLDRAYGLDQTLRDIHLVVERQLNRDDRRWIEWRRGLW